MLPRRSAARGDDRPTFVLGMGCQKGGTTWLHDYLSASPQFLAGYRKEFHVFDALDLREREGERAGELLLRRAARHLDQALRGEPYRPYHLHLASMCGNLDFYFDYFLALLNRRDQVRATGDFTPTYGALPEARVAEIQRRFARRGVRTVGLFVMRDPVERIWSHVRMLVQRGGGGLAGAVPEEAVARQFAKPHFELRTRYGHTLDVLDAVFDPRDRWVGFYEELFTEQRVREICDAIGVAYRPPEFALRSNASPKAGSGLPEDVARTVAEHYADVYREVARRFPDKDLHALWPNARLVL